MLGYPGLDSHQGSAFLGDSEAPGEMARVRTRELGRENRRLQDLATQLQEKHHRISLEVGIGGFWMQLEFEQGLGLPSKDLRRPSHSPLPPVL